MLNKFIVTLAVLNGLAGCSVYPLKETDTSLKGGVERWAEASGKELKWELDDLDLQARDGLNEKLKSASNLKQALEELVSAIEQYRLTRPREPGQEFMPPVVACIYSNVVVVKYHRSIAIPCSSTVGPSFNSVTEGQDLSTEALRAPQQATLKTNEAAKQPIDFIRSTTPP